MSDLPEIIIKNQSDPSLQLWSLSHQFTPKNNEITLGRKNLNLSSDKISRKCLKITSQLSMDFAAKDKYEIKIHGLLDPMAPAILIKYYDDLTYKDTLTEGMVINYRDVEKLKFMVPGDGDVTFELGLVSKTQEKIDQNSSADSINSDIPVTSTLQQTIPNLPAPNLNTASPPSASPPRPQINQTTNAPREGCRFMNSCYRNNPQHKIQFSHPTDSDWHQGECPYGTRCYRKNKVHQARYTHKKRQAAVAAKNNMGNMHNSDDDSELEFESSDEYDEDQEEVISSEEEDQNFSEDGMDSN